MISVGSRIFLSNRQSADVVLPAGLVLAGFYKGKWWQLKGDNDDGVSPADFAFDLQDATTPIMLGNKYTTVGTAIKQKRETDPTQATVCYYDLHDAPKADDPSFFRLSVKYRVYFKSQDPPAKVKEEPGNEDGGGIKGEKDMQQRVVQQGHLGGAS